MKRLVIFLGVVGLLLPFQVQAKDNKALSNDLYLQQGERFTIVCDYPNAHMVYGYNGSTGLVGYCE